MVGIDAVVQSILWLAGAIGIIGGAVVLISKCINPSIRLRQRVEALEKSQEDNSETIRVIGRGVFVLVNHAVTGNAVDKVREIQDEMQKRLFK